MTTDFKNIHIGQMIERRVTESGIEISRICNFLQKTEDEIKKIYKTKSVDTDILLKWSKLLKYDFFRIYSQHLILYAPQGNICHQPSSPKFSFPKFRKNVYTKEIIDFILEEITSGTMTKQQIVEKYRIPKTTLYKWITKYKH